ncbi:hypothetical protein DVH24_013589 [Malus domestica]|uniref:Uncharacterized protein n=1 Tax=Malus domestica TaxID=3750 RepID=A0A498JGT2_MALDO|nr:hypothetical protein DVH24_013589 [Malus domestica]
MGWRSTMAAKAQGDNEDDDPDGVESLMMVLKSIASMIYQGYLPEVYADSEGVRRRYKPRHHHLSRICHPETKKCTM